MYTTIGNIRIVLKILRGSVLERVYAHNLVMLKDLGLIRFLFYHESYIDELSIASVSYLLTQVFALNRLIYSIQKFLIKV